MRTAINAMVSEIRLTLHIVDATRMVVPRKHSRSPAVLAVLVSVTCDPKHTSEIQSYSVQRIWKGAKYQEGSLYGLRIKIRSFSGAISE